MGKNIVLVGFMGSGKSTVGRRLARRLGYGYVDTDQMVESKAGKRVAEIFKEEGEAVFRALERLAVEKASMGDSRVIACGGGAVIDRENVVALKRNGALIYLKASKASLIERLERGIEKRPLLKTEDVEARVRELLEQRVKIYERVSDAVVDTDGLSPAGVVEEIIRMVRSREVEL